MIKTLLKAEGINDDQSIADYEDKYNEILELCREEIDPDDEQLERHEDLFELLQENYIRKYKMNSRLFLLLDEGIFDCFSGTVLYTALAKDLFLNYKIRIMPNHIFLSFNKDNEEYIIDMTEPALGVYLNHDEDDLDEIIENLLEYKLITREEISNKGKDSIYKEFYVYTDEIAYEDIPAIGYSNLAASDLINGNLQNAVNKVIEAYNRLPGNRIIGINLLNITDYICNNHEFTTDSLANILPEYLKIEKLDSANAHFLYIVFSKELDNLTDQLNYYEAELILDFLKEDIFLPVDKEYYLKFEEFYIIKKSRSLYFNESKKDSYIFLKERIGPHINSNLIWEHFLSIFHDYIVSLRLNQEFDTAYNEMNEIINKYGFDKLNMPDLYVAVQIDRYYEHYTEKHIEGIEFLSKQLEILPNHKLVIKLICRIYHEYAMEKIRDSKFKEAMKIVNDGLKYDDSNKILLGDKESITNYMK